MHQKYSIIFMISHLDVSKLERTPAGSVRRMLSQMLHHPGPLTREPQSSLASTLPTLDLMISSTNREYHLQAEKLPSLKLSLLPFVQVLRGNSMECAEARPLQSLLRAILLTESHQAIDSSTPTAPILLIIPIS